MDNSLTPIYYTLFSTPVGNLVSCSSEKGIIMVLFEEEATKYLQNKNLVLSARLINSKNEFLEKLELQLTEYFSGNRKSFNIPFEFKGSDFQNWVWQIVGDIPFGETRSYVDIAKKIGGTNFTRAVANANAKNDILLLIPCHRVLGTENKLTGYRGGLARKRWLIEFERTNSLNDKKNTLF